MASIRDLKKRIQSVKNTQQTTRAMKMVSAAKLRRAQQAIDGQREYALEVDRLIRKLLRHSEAPQGFSLIQREHFPEEKSDRKVLFVVVSSDRGLCGGFNANIIKSSQNWVKENQSAYESVEMAFVGKKAYEVFKARGWTEKSTYYELFGNEASFNKVLELNQWILKRVVNEEIDEVWFAYNAFKNAISQLVAIEKWLPLEEAKPFWTFQEEETTQNQQDNHNEDNDIDLYLLKPSLEHLLNKLVDRHLASQTFRVMLESQASEHGARMAAMDNATNNAEEMVGNLRLQYNKQRQAGITKELMEIISGSESQN